MRNVLVVGSLGSFLACGPVAAASPVLACVYGSTHTAEERQLASYLERLFQAIGVDATVDFIDARAAPALEDLARYALVVESEPELLYHHNNPNSIDPVDLLARGTSILVLEDAIHDIAQCPRLGGSFTQAGSGEIEFGAGCVPAGALILGLRDAPQAFFRLASACGQGDVPVIGARERAGPGEGRLLFFGIASDTDYASPNNRVHEDLLRWALAWVIDAGDRPFRRGDANASGAVDIADAVAIVRHLFSGGSAPCLDAMDVDDNGLLTVGDAIGVLMWLFKDGAEPAAPGPRACGADPNPDLVSCDMYDRC